MQLGRAGSARERMRVDVYLPDERARGGIHAVGVGLNIAKINRRERCVDRDGGPYSSGRFVGPVDTTGARVERVDSAILAAQKESPTGYGGLAERGCGVRKPESPLQFQGGYLVCRQAGKRLEARVREVHSPTVPDGAATGLRSALGAKARARVGGRQISRQVMPTRSYLSQSELPVTFGVGKRDKIERVTIEWPSGRSEEFKDLGSGRSYQCIEGKGLEE